MHELIIHKTPQEFLDSNYSYLIKNELENNLTMGICLSLENRTNKFPGFNFVSVTDNSKVEAVSVRTTPRVVISANNGSDKAIGLLAEYYEKINNIIGGVIGEKKISGKFAEQFSSKQIGKRELKVHELEKTNDITLSEGKFKQTESKDLELITNFRTKFDNETFGYSRLTYENLMSDTEDKIVKGNFFSWTVEGKVVSIAAIMRSTKSIGIIGLVYTPEELRGNGYASSAVLSLSNEILKRGFTKCGLFTDISNPVSNHIYYKIGYRPKLDFSDIYFERVSN